MAAMATIKATTLPISKVIKWSDSKETPAGSVTNFINL